MSTIMKNAKKASPESLKQSGSSANKDKEDFSLDIKNINISDVSSDGAWLACKGCSGCFD